MSNAPAMVSITAFTPKSNCKRLKKQIQMQNEIHTFIQITQPPKGLNQNQSTSLNLSSLSISAASTSSDKCKSASQSNHPSKMFPSLKVKSRNIDSKAEIAASSTILILNIIGYACFTVINKGAMLRTPRICHGQYNHCFSFCN